MGRRSRKRAAAPHEGGLERTPESRGSGGPPRPQATSRRRSRRGEPPAAPWGPFPLVELCVLLALILGVLGLVTGGRRGFVILACAVALGSLAGLELSIREHFAGYRSHSTVLAGAVAVAAGAAMYFTSVPQVVVLVAGAAIFFTAFFALREVFRRRSGGFGFR